MEKNDTAQDESFDAKTGENDNLSNCNGMEQDKATEDQQVLSDSHFFGVDFGSQRCVLADASGEIVLNELGGMTTATLVAFKGDERLIGESAVLSAATNPSNTIDFVNELLGKSRQELDLLHSYWPGERAPLVNMEQQQLAADSVACQVEYRQQTHHFTPVQLAAILFGKLQGYVNKKCVDDVPQKQQHFLVAVPSNWNASQRDALQRALHIAGIVHHTLLTREVALARCFQQDFTMELSQQTLEAICKAETRKLQALLHKVLGVEPNANASDGGGRSSSSSNELVAKLGRISSIEIVGGGTRMPLVQEAILQAISDISGDTQIPIGRMLDSTTSVAVGAAFCQDLARLDDAQVIAARDASLQNEIELEAKMAKKDAQLALIAHERNAIESFIYEMRAKKHQKHGELLSSTTDLDKLLQDAEEWIYTEEAETATLDLLKEVNANLQEQVRSACSEYFAAVETDNKQFESQLEKEASKAAAEAALEDGDDHDTRKLKKPERMRLLTKNKEEGNELFRGGNYQHAIMRYIKALGHASKFFDLSAQDKEEVDQIKKSLYLNLAQCYLKLENWQKAISNADAVLDIENTNVKALYRRACAYERQNELEKATQDVADARKLAPEDKLVARLEERLKILNQRQLDKEKKMWSRAFA